ncbi:Endochitinase 2 [Tolypocladium paradoxum]|uniref:Endochitinase 2 n=1 Tax=Tolypocladium paradoxum TaxID=94208 RepID=A0A2S4KLD2_9HYPO|nr:Endochitinase 2 [Tolypocladium paradoxum]
MYTAVASLMSLGLMATAALAAPHGHHGHKSCPAPSPPPAPSPSPAPSSSPAPSPPSSAPAPSPPSSSPAPAPPGKATSLHRVANGGQNVVYWGQNGGNVVENNDLASYCTSASGIDVIVLAFLYEYGNGVSIASGTIGQSCSISTSGEGQQCADLATAIDTCKSNGVKVILSLGGAVGAYSLGSRQEAETIGQNLWDAYGKSAAGSVPRPFGKTFVNGWDFDIEANSGNQYYQYLIAKLRSNFASDPANTYYITGAPQCPIPEPNMNQIVTTSQFDYLFVQFYNNPGCSVDGTINYDAWKQNIANTPSSNASIFIGVPAAPLGATGTQSGARYYLQPSALASLTSKYASDAAFGGIMMWAAGFSDSNVNNGCTYAQEAKHILTTGSAC